MSGLSSRANHGVGFVDEQNDRDRRGFHFFDQSFQAIFEFTFDARSGLQQREIERPHGDVAQRRGHVSVRYAQGESFHYSGFSDSCFARKDRIVLPASHQNVDNLADFEVAAQYGIDLAGLGFLREINRELVEIGSFATRTRSPRRCAWRRCCGCHGRLRLFVRIAHDRGEILAQQHRPGSSETHG